MNSEKLADRGLREVDVKVSVFYNERTKQYMVRPYRIDDKGFSDLAGYGTIKCIVPIDAKPYECEEV